MKIAQFLGNLAVIGVLVGIVFCLFSEFSVGVPTIVISLFLGFCIGLFLRAETDPF
jgi:xanthosine utilization system XapX-like protein